MLLVIFLVILFVLAAIVVIRNVGPSARATQAIVDAMTDEQKQRVYAAQSARRKQKLLFAVFAIGLLIIAWATGYTGPKPGASNDRPATTSVVGKPATTSVVGTWWMTPAAPKPTR